MAAALRQRAVIVRHFAAPRISDYLRITVGTDAQIDRLLSALLDILEATRIDLMALWRATVGLLQSVVFRV